VSQENIELARRAYEAFNRDDLEGMVADFAPSFEYLPSGTIPGTHGVYRGAEGWIEFMGWLRNEFESARVEILELIETEHQVLAAVTAHGRGRQSGVEASWDGWHLWTVRDGKVVHGRGFTSRAEALEAAGLLE
jgi:ketosteroid isomerase-like protein